ncbi:MAG TPA: hypothetical protein VFW70_21235 [Methylomirabilota bacterium]|nr:hypothetical protein [Methylomirabilota bacterium]
MARRGNAATRGEGRAEYIVHEAIGAAEALSVGVLRLTERTLIEALHTVQDVGSELGSTVVRAARGSIKAAETIGGDLVEVGRGVSRGISQPAREVGGEVARLATGLWSNVTDASGRGAARVKKAPVKAAGRRSRKRSAA